MRAAGIIRKGPERVMVDDYVKRANGLARSCGFHGLSETQLDVRSAKTRQEETLRILGGLNPADKLIVLDERGKAQNSQAIARKISQWRDGGIGEAIFAIGAADGFDHDAIPKGAELWSFGPAVWPHKLVRVMLCEQLYRALSSLSGRPYHRE